MTHLLTAKCRRCKRHFDTSSRRLGRPRLYCGQGCKRAAEYEVGRITRRLEVLERLISDAHLQMTRRRDVTWHRERIVALRGEYRRLDARLRELLD